MAKSLTPSLSSLLTAVVSGDRSLSKLTPKQATQLAQANLIEVSEEGAFQISNKGNRAAAKSAKVARQVLCNDVVSAAFLELTADGAVTQHRPIWVAVGKSTWTRDEVLNSLKVLRDAAQARTFKLSNNNFQIFWAQPEVKSADGEAAIPGVDEV
jgi:hypothetical protein